MGINMFSGGKIRELPSNLRCDICGRQFANTSAKEKHMSVHFMKARKEGLVPRFVQDKHGDTIFKGMKTDEWW